MPKGLVLTRKPGQTILVGDDIQIHVGDIRNGQVRFRIVAPPSVVIRRVEAEDYADWAKDHANGEESDDGDPEA